MNPIHSIAIRIRFAFAFMVVALSTQVVSACPTCKDGLHHDAALGYAISIIFMMSMPILIMAFWAILIWRLRAKVAVTSTAQPTTK